MSIRYRRREFLKLGATVGTGLVLGGASLSGCARPPNGISAEAQTIPLDDDKKTNERIAYCGINCLKCPIYLATREQDGERRKQMRQKIAQRVTKQYGQQCRPEDVGDCDGCKAESGRLFPGCGKCNIRKCAKSEGVENCARCEKYPCEELSRFHATEPDAKKRLDEIRSRL